MAEKHTPGPWTTIKGDEDNPERWNVIVDGPQGWHIAVIENGAPGDTLKTEEANASLIADSPTMLALLRDVLACGIQHDDRGHAFIKVPARSLLDLGAAIGDMVRKHI